MSKYAFGVDVGGTTVKLGFFDTEGTLLDKWEIPTNTADSGSHILPDIAAAVKKKMAEVGAAKEDVAGIGMGVPGPVTEDGVILKGVNLGWGVFNVEEALSALTGLPCKAGNDANVAALGEMYKGAAMGHANVIMMTFGTGVGGGIIVDGKVVAGKNGSAGEIGHMPVNHMETEPCSCGRCGCFEQYASATGLANLAKRLIKAFNINSVLKYYEPLTTKEIFAAYHSGDELAKSLIEDWGDMVGKAMATLALVTNPDVFVIGGGLSKAGDVLIDIIKRNYERYTYHATADTQVVLATLGNDAGIYGGAKMILG